MLKDWSLIPEINGGLNREHVSFITRCAGAMKQGIAKKWVLRSQKCTECVSNLKQLLVTFQRVFDSQITKLCLYL